MNIGVIGCGNMAGAMIKGISQNGHNLHIYNRTKEKALQYKCNDVFVYDNEIEVINSSEVIILGLKPNQYIEWLKNHDLSNKTLISIAAGMTSDMLNKVVDNFIITMPNTPALNKKGFTLVVESPYLTDDILSILNTFGETKVIKEEQLEVYMLVSGCSPAYFFLYVDLLANTLSDKYNLDKNEIEKILVNVMEGSLFMLKENIDANTLTQNVCSPGGVTIEVVNKLKEELPQILDQGFENAYRRNQELKEGK